MNITKTLVASVLALLCSVAIAVVIGYYVPRVVSSSAILWGIWLPWFLLPYSTSIRNFGQAALALAPPAIITVAGGIPPGALVEFALALALGAGARRFLAEKKRAT